MVYLNLLSKISQFTVITLSLFLTNFCHTNQQDSLEKFYEKRFGIYPPSEEESQAALLVIESFLKNITSKNFNNAYFLDTTPSFQQSIALDKFKIFVQKFEDINLEQKLDYHLVTFVNTTHNKASYEWLTQGKNKYQQFSIHFSLIYEDDDWKISYIKIYETFKTR